MGKNLDAKNTVKMELLYGTQRRKETKKEWLRVNSFEYIASVQVKGMTIYTGSCWITGHRKKG
jgi:hypothetical protein